MTTRAQVVAEARKWLGTPYHKRACILGAGVDCGLLLYAVYRAFDLVPDMSSDLPTLEDDWFAHTSDMRYARIIERYFHKLVDAQARIDPQPEFLPGNLITMQSYGSRVLNHGGIITDWPKVVHSCPPYGVMEVNVGFDPFWAFQKIVVYDIGLAV